MNVVSEIELDDVGELTMIPQDIGRAVNNIFINSFSAVHSKFESFGHEFEPIIKINLFVKDDQYACIHIYDNGIGIPEEVKRDMYTPFFTTKDPGKGAGLGLSMVSDIITSHRRSNLM